MNYSKAEELLYYCWKSISWQLSIIELFSQGKGLVWLSVFSHMQQWSRGLLMYIMVKSKRLIWLVMPKTRWLLEVKDLREIFWNNDHCHTSKYLLFPQNLAKCYYKKIYSSNSFALIKDTMNPLQLFIFINALRCSRLLHWVGCFIYFKFTRVSYLNLAQLKKQIV